MGKATSIMKDKINNTNFEKPKNPIISNVTGVTNSRNREHKGSAYKTNRKPSSLERKRNLYDKKWCYKFY